MNLTSLPSSSTTAATLLYLEDDEILAQVTLRALSKRGSNVCHFSSLQKANEAGAWAQFSHALLDLKLEDGHSLQLLEALKSANPNMHILILTGYASIATAVQAIKLGATNYLAKPATVEQIIQAFEPEPLAPSSAEDPADPLSLRRLEWEHIQKALADNQGNVSATARQLKMHRRTLQRKLYKKPVTE